MINKMRSGSRSEGRFLFDDIKDLFGISLTYSYLWLCR